MRRVCLVGAGFISRAHAEALSALPHVRLAAVADPDRAAAAAFAARYGVTTAPLAVFSSAEEAAASPGVDCAHVLAPPDRHAEAAIPFLRAGKPVLCEKPMAESETDCGRMLEAAADSGAILAVQQNFLFHPAFLKLRRTLASGTYGKPRSVSCAFTAPLRQLAARQLGHWMFRRPTNLLLEQAVHPLSQIVALSGAPRHVRALADAPIEPIPGLPVHAGWSVCLSGGAIPAQLRLEVGCPFPHWTLALFCDDGVLVADVLRNRFHAESRGPGIEAVDHLASALGGAGALIRDGVANAARFAAETLGLSPTGGAFRASVRAAVSDFHAALDGGGDPAAPGPFGAELVRICEAACRDALGDTALVASPQPVLAATGLPPADVVLIGGTGFIGEAATRRLAEAGLTLRIAARTPPGPATAFRAPGVHWTRCDVREPASVRQAIGCTPLVVNIAHGGGGGSPEAARRAMLDGAENVARACLDAGVRRLVHIGSVAALYLGPDAGRVDGATPPDPKSAARPAYARAKAECDRLLLALRAECGLPVVILRPGIVVGAGGPPFHTGFGSFNNEQHCLGWNAGTNPLPLVLVEDVAEAILLALRAEGIDGRCYNLAGDVRLGAREAIAAIAAATGRPLRFHPRSPRALWTAETAKWAVKRAGGRRNAPRPAFRDILSRGMRASLDCSDAKQDLGWHPEADAAAFVRRAFDTPRNSDPTILAHGGALPHGASRRGATTPTVARTGETALQRFIAANRNASNAIEARLGSGFRPNFYRRYEQLVADRVRAAVRSGARPVVLDIGGGKKCQYRHLLDSITGVSVVSVDIDESELRQNKDAHGRIVADAVRGLPFADACADVVTLRSVMEHLEDTDRFLAECARVLRPGGHLVCLFPGRFSPFALLNRLLPHRMAQQLLYYFHPYWRLSCGFRAYYDNCWHDRMAALMGARGLEVVSADLRYYQALYYTFFVPLYLVSLGYDMLLHAVGARNLASQLLFVARKTVPH